MLHSLLACVLPLTVGSTTPSTSSIRLLVPPATRFSAVVGASGGSAAPAIPQACAVPVNLTAALPPANDSCSTPSPLTGSGPFAFNTTTASTGAEGQSESRCSFYGSSGIDNDVWYCWTAPATGPFQVDSRTTTFDDTKIAVYDGCGCPLNPAIGCNDDGCGYSGSLTRFQAIAGHVYAIQLGSGPGSPGGTGTFSIDPSPLPASGCQLDDGSSEQVFGAGSAATHLVWTQVFGTVGIPTLVTSVSAAYGSPTSPGTGPAIGQAVDVLVWEDPNDDGNPVDAILAYQGTGVVGNVDNDVFDVYPTTPLVLDGRFMVGIGMIVNASLAPISASDDFACQPLLDAWFVGDNTGLVDYTNLSNPSYSLPLTELSLVYFGHFMLRSGCTTSASTNLCGNGDPLRIPCPCGNDGANALGGCTNSVSGSTGAVLRTDGFQRLDDVVLQASGMTGGVCTFFASTGTGVPAGTLFGDGVTCTGSSLIRIRTVNFAGGLAGIAVFPGPSDTITLSARSGTSPGSGLALQYCTFYRNAASYCTPATFNVSNTQEVLW